MQEDKPRLARLIAILTQLQSKRIVTGRDIAEKHKVSIRTIYRDMRTLEKSGIPIVTEEGKGYSLMQGYKIPPVMFTEEETNALATAEQLLKKNKDQSLVEHFDTAFIKIKSVLAFSEKDRTEILASRIQVRNNHENIKTSDYLIQVQSAISNYRLIAIVYLSLENQKSDRVIEPFALYTSKDNWILIAFCRLKNDFRAFRLDCIQDLNMLDTLFEPHKITLQEYLEECRKKMK